MLSVCQQVYSAVLLAIRPGIRGSELYAIAAAASRAQPYFTTPELTRPALFYSQDDLQVGRFFMHNVSAGHGIGREAHELPYLTPANVVGVPDPPLEPNMVLTVESAQTSWTVFNIEDSVTVTPDGFDLLSTMDRGLAVC